MANFHIKFVNRNILLRYFKFVEINAFVTGTPTHRGPVLFCSLASFHVCHRLSSSVTLHGGPAGGFTRAGQAMTSCRLLSNYSSTVTLHGGPVVLRYLVV